MQPLGAILLGIATIAIGQSPAPPDAAVTDKAIDAALLRYDQLPADSRGRWAQELLVRLERAGAVVLAGEEADRQQQRTEKFARLLDRGYQPPRSSIRNLLVELDRREQQAVERLARRYRMQIYRTFRQQDAVFRARQAAWEKVESTWQSAGGPIEQQPQLIDWLVVATYRSTPGTIGPLPGPPDFSPQIGLPQKPPGMIAGGPRRPESALPEAILRPDIEPRRPIAALDVLPQPDDAAPQTPPTGDWILAAPVKPGDARTETGEAALVDDRTRVPVRGPGGMVPPVSRAALEPAGPAGLPVPDPSDLASRMPAGASSPARPLPVDQPRPPEGDAGVGDWLLAQPSDPAERSDVHQPPRSTLAEAGPPERRGIEAPTAAGIDPLPEPPVAAHYPPGGRWPDFPAEPPSETSTAEPPPAEAPADPVEPPPVRVNLKELAAGIAGANLALRALEAELDNDEALPSARRTASLVDRLEILVLRHDDLALFCELIGPDELSQVGRPESARAVIPRLAKKIFSIRTHVSGKDFSGDAADREFELELLGELSRRLAKLAEKP